MKRREFIAGLGSAVAWPLNGRAQQGERVRRVGVLTYGDAFGATPRRKLLSDNLEKLGWIEGRNLRLDFRFGEDATQTRIFAAELAQLAPDVIVASYGAAVRAVQQQTKTVPIVFVGAGDPAENGTVKNTAHPEGNATGFANGFGSLGGKLLELLKEVAPNLTRVASLYPVYLAGSVSFLQSMETAGQSLGVQVIGIPISDADGMKAEIEAFAAWPNAGLVLNAGIFFIMRLVELIRLVAQYRLPAIYGGALPPASGGLMSYSADPDELLLGAASYVDRLLRGAKVSDLPVQYPTKFRLAINLNTAKALGLVVPSSILVRADEVIE